MCAAKDEKYIYTASVEGGGGGAYKQLWPHIYEIRTGGQNDGRRWAPRGPAQKSEW